MVVTPWTPELRMLDVVFSWHRGARSMLSAPRDLDSLNLISARQAIISFPNGARQSIIGQLHRIDAVSRFLALHGDLMKPSYEVLRTDGRSQEPTNHCSPEDVEEMWRSIMAEPDPEFPVFSEEALEPPFSPPASFSYDADVYGRFLFDDSHRSLPRVAIDISYWREFTRAGKAMESAYQRYFHPVLVINQWCADHLNDDFAWTAYGPSWAFRSEDDALLFKMRWS